MIEVMYSIAPSATYAFATGLGGEANYANNVKALADVGCQILTDDVRYFGEPVFEPGVVEQAIASNLDKGVYHITAAGNFANQGYFKKFKSSKKISYRKGTQNVQGIPSHVFPDGKNYVEISASDVTRVMIILQWNQAFSSLGGSGAKTDLDIVFSDLGANNSSVPELFTTSTSIQKGTDPIEVKSYTIKAGSKLRVYIANANKGPNPVFYINIFGNSLLTFSKFFSGPTSIAHSGSPHAISVGAANYLNTPPFKVNPPTLEEYSSFGGLPRYFNLDQEKINPPVIYKKPDIIGPTGFATSFFGELDSQGILRFYGTSCAAPGIAALSGLIKEIQPSISFSNLKKSTPS